MGLRPFLEFYLKHEYLRIHQIFQIGAIFNKNREIFGEKVAAQKRVLVLHDVVQNLIDGSTLITFQSEVKYIPTEKPFVSVLVFVFEE